MEKVEKFIQKNITEKVPKMEKPKEIGEGEPVAEKMKETPEKARSPKREKSFRTEENSKLKQVREELKKKFQEIERDLEKRKKVETIEKLFFPPRSKMELLLTFLGEKSSVYFDTKEKGWFPADLPPEQKRTVNEEILERIEKSLKNLKLFYEIKKRESGETANIFVSKTKENLIKLTKAFEEKDWEKMGIALDYPKSATEAYLKRFKEKGSETVESLIEETAKSLSEEEREQLMKEGSYRFLTFGPSPEGFKEEIKLARKYQEIVKKESPAIYNEIMNR